MINIEYCHITPNLNADAEIYKANTSIKLLDILKQEGPHQFSLFIDDLYDSSVTDSMIESWVARLHIKPDIVFSEKSLHPIAQILVSKIDPNKVQIRANVRGKWIKTENKRYFSEMEFIIERTIPTGTEYTCAILAASSYLWRLGYFPDAPIRYYGEGRIQFAESIINVINPYFLEVESQARKIIELSYPEAISRISWVFI